MSTPELNIAWAAGLFEGEGTIQLRTSNRSRRDNSIEQNVSIIMQLAMTDEDVVRKFHEAVFGIGTVSGPFYNKQATVSGKPRKPTWAWRTTKIDACITVYTLLRPHLGIRRRATGDAALRGRWEYERDSAHFNTQTHEFPEWITGGPVLDAG